MPKLEKEKNSPEKITSLEELFVSIETQLRAMEEKYDLTREELITAIEQTSGISSEAHEIIKLDHKYPRGISALASLKIK